MTEEEVVLERLKLIACGGVPAGVVAETLSRVIAFCHKKGKGDAGKKLLYCCLDTLTKIWRSCVRDMNDIRLYQELDMVQLQFSCCYAVMRRYPDLVFAYENVLRFKNVASLAVRERNRIYHSNGMREILKLSEAHNEMADREAEGIWHNSPGRYMGDAVYRKKLAADAEFYEQFPKEAAFTEITWEKIRRAIPDNSAVIEYFLCDEDEYGSNGTEPPLDIYIVCKKNDCCTLKKEVISDGKSVMQAAGRFVSAFRKESAERSPFSQNLDNTRKELLGRYLYRWLIEPVLAHIQGVRRLFIAPNRDLMNLPFEILKDDDAVRLGTEYDVIQMECARDFLFCGQERISARGSLIIGEPQYEIPDRDGKAERILTDIPFSGVEARLISGLCGSRCFTKSVASKNLLLSAEGYRNIHIATHGCFDSRQEAAYASCLAFAGAENWLQTGRKSGTYGNGLVTADEISRLNLHSVELAVISACNSGMNEILKNKGFHGLLGGFSAAGARYVISSLWAADDLATAILMGYFYYEYMKKQEKPYTALKNAKEYIRKASTGRLKRDGWFTYMLEQDIDSKSRKLIRQYESGNESERPFENEVYWGGFICYRCN